MDLKLIPAEYGPGDVEVLREETVWREWGRVVIYEYRHKRHDGSWSGTVKREMHAVRNTASVLPWDPALDAVVLTEQLRMVGLFQRAGRPWVIECIAGMIDEGEDPGETARREAEEETGARIGKLIPVMSGYTSPGAWGEKSHLFTATANLSQVGGFHGLASENEDIRALVVPFDEAFAAVSDGRIEDVKTALLLHWLAANKDKLL